MIVELAGTALFSGVLLSRGASPTAEFIDSQTKSGYQRLQESYILGQQAKGSFNALYKVFVDCSQPNWDGYGAVPITEHTLLLAKQFLGALPLGIPAPSIGAEPDGHITIEWYRSTRRTLSVSVSPDGDLHYAALIGASKYYGTEPFYGNAPMVIVNLIHRVTFA